MDLSKRTKKKLTNLHNKFKSTLSTHIGFQYEELETMKERFEYVVTPKDLIEISSFTDLLKCLEKNGFFQTGKYDKLMEILCEFDKRLSDENHDAQEML